jgi:hypothetical protein
LEAIKKAARDQPFNHTARGLGARSVEEQVDLKTSREIVVGSTRVVLLQVRRTIDFTDAGADTAPRAITSVRIVYLMEYVGDKSVEVVSQGAEAFIAGTTEPALRGAKGTAKAPSELKTESYSGYRKRFAAVELEQAVARLPKVKDVNKAVVAVVTFDDVEVAAPKVDLRLAAGLLKGEEDRRVLFRNVPLE